MSWFVHQNRQVQRGLHKDEKAQKGRPGGPTRRKYQKRCGGYPMNDAEQARHIVSERQTGDPMNDPFVEIVDRTVSGKDSVVERVSFQVAPNRDHHVAFVVPRREVTVS